MDPRDRRERAAQEAAEWLLRLQEQSMSRTQRTEFVRWLRESPLHVAEMLRVSHVHGELASFPDWKEIEPLDTAAVAPPVLDLPTASSRPVRTAPRRKVRSWLWPSVLAACTVALGVAFPYFTALRHRTIDSGTGERREVTLVDGSVVRLSPQTTLRVQFTEHERHVVLSRGDALFRVAKDHSRPFFVETDHTRVRAVGTAFGVEHHADSIIVTVEEGRVAVIQTPSTSLPAFKPRPPLTEISLGADQQVVVPHAGPVGGVRRVDSHRELSWADGRLIFDHEPVAEVVRRFNRFNRVQMQVLDPQLAVRPVSAVFDAADPEAFITFLESVANVRVTRPSPDVIMINVEGPN